MSLNKKVSVIVPMYNAEVFLPELFNCFDNCNFVEGDEIILVDNNSTDKTYQMCEEKMSSKKELYHLLKYDLKADSYAARNHAVKHATGDVFAFTDSDCKPTKEWLNRVRNGFSEGEVLAGEVQLEILNNGVWECFDAITHLSQSKEHIANDYVATANMSVHRKDFFDIGLFEERFAGGDFEWSKRASRKGYKIKYCPEALVYHPSRKTYDEILTRERRGAYGAGKAQKMKNGSYPLLVVKYFLKIFKADTYMKLTKKLKQHGISSKELRHFNVCFFKIRREQLKSAIAGYKGLDARSIGVK